MQQKVKEFMVPIGDFPTVLDTATFNEAFLALEKAQENFQAGKAKQRIVIVRDAGNKVVGKLSPLDLIKGLEPDFDRVVNVMPSTKAAAMDYVIKTMRQTATLWSKPLEDLCGKAKNVQIKDFLKRPKPTQVIQAEDSLNNALHNFVFGGHDSLFVTEGGRLVGILRFSDVYRFIGDKIKSSCRL